MALRLRPIRVVTGLELKGEAGTSAGLLQLVEIDLVPVLDSLLTGHWGFWASRAELDRMAAPASAH